MTRALQGVTAVGIVVFALVGTTAAHAKYLPVVDLQVRTATPVAGEPIEVVVRFGVALGDVPAARTAEVFIISAEGADEDGWPRDLPHHGGRSVPVSPVTETVYSGSVVVDAPGNYVVFSWSSYLARNGELVGVDAHRVAKPVRLSVISGGPKTVGPAPVTAGSQASLSGWWLAVPTALVAAVTVAGLRLRRRSRPGTTPGSPA